MSLNEDISRLNPQQLAIVKRFKKPSLIVAGPGTGKTRTVSVLIGDLLRKGTKLKEILALTFSNKAAKELRSRVLEYYPHSFDECWISTFHSFCARLLREQYYLVGIAPDFKLLTSFKEALLISGICKKQQTEAFQEFGKVLNMRGFQQEILTFISLLKSNLISVEEFENILNTSKDFSNRSLRRLNEILNLYKLYELEIAKTGYLDFRDLISLSIKVLQNEKIAELYRNKFSVILVDEFQDTDPAQFLLLSLLKGPEPTGKIAVIGDPRQSIYRFRGANPDMMSRTGPFKKKYKAKIFPLQINYRCSKEVLKAAQKLDWNSSDDEESIIAKSEIDGFVNLYIAKDELDEARIITRKIASLLIYGGEGYKYKPEDIAILVRNNYQIDLITESLRNLKIPFEIAGDMKFFRSEEVITLVSLLKSISLDGAERNEALSRAFSSRIFELDPIWVQAVISNFSSTSSMTTLLNKLSDNDFEDLPETSEENKIKAMGFAETINLLSMLDESSLKVVFARLLLTVSKILSNPESAEARNILHLRNMVSDYCEVFEKQHGREPIISDINSDFDEWLTYYASTLEQEQGTGSGGVNIMTVHQSKGLEFPVVVVSGLCENSFPTAHRENLLVSLKDLERLKQAADKSDRNIPFFNPYPSTYEDHLEEERRLFYVALTRAKEGVILSYPKRIGTDLAMPAPFIKEIGAKTDDSAAETRPLSISELRTNLSALPQEAMDELEPIIESVSKDLISKNLSYFGLRPRNFNPGKIDEVDIPEDFVFSASSIKNYVDCPRKFLFKNVFKIQNPVMSDQSYLIFGNAVHRCLEILHAPGGDWDKCKYPTDEDYENIIEEHASEILGSIEYFERHAKLKKMKEAFPVYRNAIFDLKQVNPRNTFGIEKSFSFNFRGFRCIGRFDRTIKEGNSLTVVDYKTSSTCKNSEKLFKLAFPEDGLPQEIQMPFYLLACKYSGYKAASAILLYVLSDAYKKKTKGLQPGFIRAAAINYGCGPEWGLNVSETQFSVFEDRLESILNRIRLDRIFDCEPSSSSEARTCIAKSQKGSMCEFLPFCQERLEQLKVEGLCKIQT